MINSKPKICIDHLIKIYGKKPHAALKLFREGKSKEHILQTTSHVLGIADVSLAVNQGELFVVMGLSGSGKSTLIRCINRLIHPTSGHIYIDDEDVAHVNEKRMREIRLTKVSMVFQRFGLFPHKTVAQNVEYGLLVRGVDKSFRCQKALEALELVGLAQWADYLPDSLSGGMQQRVGLARALATDAEILLMDEPFSALDPLIRREMQDELLRLQKQLHKTIIFISHDIHEALKIGDRIAVMKDGSIVQVGTPVELINQPASTYIREFTRNINRLQILKAGSIARQTTTLILGQHTPKAALEQLLNHRLKQMYVVDRNGILVGLVQKKFLEEAILQGCENITAMMLQDVSKVDVSTPLDNILHLYQQERTVAVIDADERFQGVIEASDVLASISSLR